MKEYEALKKDFACGNQICRFQVKGETFSSQNYNTMTSSNGTIFRITGPLCGVFTNHWWIPLTKASDAELLCFLWFVPEQMVD